MALINNSFSGVLGTPKNKNTNPLFSTNGTISNQGLVSLTPQTKSQPAQKITAQPKINTQTTTAQNKTQNPPVTTSALDKTIPQATFPSLVGSLASTANQAAPGFSQAQANSQQAQQNLMQQAPQQNQDIQAQKQKIENLQSEMALANGNIGAGTNLAEFAGQQGQLQNLYSGRLQAYQTGLQNLLQGTQLQQQAQTGAGQLANTAAGLATGQQATQQGGLGTAAGLYAPQLNTPGQGYYQPNLASQNGGQPVNMNIATAANVQSIKDLTYQKNQLESTFNGADANFQLLLSIAEQGGVNNLNQPALNELQKNVALGLTSNASVASFQSLINSVRDQYAAILGGGNVTVESMNQAKTLIPDSISLASLNVLRNNLSAEATNRMQGIDNTISRLNGQFYSGQQSQNDPWGIR